MFQSINLRLLECIHTNVEAITPISVLWPYYVVYCLQECIQCIQCIHTNVEAITPSLFYGPTMWYIAYRSIFVSVYVQLHTLPCLIITRIPVLCYQLFYNVVNYCCQLCLYHNRTFTFRIAFNIASSWLTKSTCPPAGAQSCNSAPLGQSPWKEMCMISQATACSLEIIMPT